jgi:diguanylate cyclase (GGDEF)-like protein
MAATRVGGLLTVTATAVAIVVATTGSGLLPDQAATVISDVAQLVAGLAATVCCGLMARRVSGVERSWRLLMLPGIAGWSIGQAIWSWGQVMADTPLPSPSLADVGYLTLPVFALAALLVFAADSRARSAATSPGSPLETTDGDRVITAMHEAGPLCESWSVRRSRLVLALDGLVVVGSLFILTWSTALGATVKSGAPTTLAFAVAIAYPITDLILVVIVVLLIAMHRVASPLRPQLLLLGFGLVGLSVSDSIFAYLVSSGADKMPPPADAGFIAGPALIAVAALTTARSRQPVPQGPVRRRATEWMHLLLPYLPLAATGVLIVVQTTAGSGPDPMEIYLGLLVGGLVVLRQMITLIENTALLDRVVEGQRRLGYQAFHDSLTGLANRTRFRDRLAHAVERGRQEQRKLALLFVDLDGFKAVNDSRGHAAGDLVLREVGNRLVSSVPDAEIVARLGEDGFGVLLDGGPPDGATELLDSAGGPDLPQRAGEQIMAALRQPFDVGGRTIAVGASLGVVVSDTTEPGLTADALLRRADAAMDTGKRRGKGRLVRYEPAVAAAIGNPDLPNLLAAALRREAESGGRPGDGLDVHYQPIVRMDDGSTVAVEALARWTSRTLGPVPADVFVAAAERAGLVGELDNLVLDRACREVAALGDQDGTPLRVHVNVCASRLCDSDLESAVSDALSRHGLPSGQLVLEITETSRIPDLTAAATVAQRLRDQGIQLAIDDFGTGYNTLAELHLMPVDIVKLCQAYTAVDAQPRQVEALCRSVVSISRALGITVIAEGVETTSQAGTLARLGCNLGQGYLYGRSAPLNQVVSELRLDRPKPRRPTIPPAGLRQKSSQSNQSPAG